MIDFRETLYIPVNDTRYAGALSHSRKVSRGNGNFHARARLFYYPLGKLATASS